MDPTRYPPQEPLSPAGVDYAAQCVARGRGITGEEHAYGPDPYQSLAIFTPPGPPVATLVFFHGGGWTNGYREWMHFMAPAFTGAGIVFVSAGYRLAPAQLFPVCLEDCREATAWVAARVGRVFVGGHSAGGHLAALLSVTAPGAVAGCLPISGVYQFGEGSGLTNRPRFLGEPGSEAAASPLDQIHGVPPPFLLAWGGDDFPHLITQAQAMASALRLAGGVVETLAMPGLTHFTASLAGGDPDGPWVPAARAFMRAHAAPQSG